jgi:hypothetical protein
MDPKTVFTIVATIMAANSGLLLLISRDLPPGLRIVSNIWQAGTFLIAAGYLVYATLSPTPAVLVLGNTLLVLGLCAYLRAVTRFYDANLPAIHYIVVVVAVVLILWFSAI